jgi:hypothetical protein
MYCKKYPVTLYSNENGQAKFIKSENSTFLLVIPKNREISLSEHIMKNRGKVLTGTKIRMPLRHVMNNHSAL